MDVFYSLKDVEKDVNTVLTIGTFDGLHLGHKKIIEEVLKKSTSFKARNFVVTFDPHPRNIISGSNSVKILSTLNEKIEVLQTIGIQNLLVIKFTKEFSQLSSEDFFKKYILESIGLKEIVIGYDHHFGKGRGGDKNTLTEMGKGFGFNVTSVEAVSVNNLTVSSTKIRHALAEGNIGLANSLLGRYYSFCGQVVKGDQRGRKLGYPTANIRLEDDNKMLPLTGIYAVEILINEHKYFGLMSIGKRPTFYNDGNIITEVHIFEFDSNIYGENIKVNIVERIRGEEKFSSAEALIEQMNNDKERGLAILGKLA
jgi:riboflavin kinase/FMN adenylyltransferase